MPLESQQKNRKSELSTLMNPHVGKTIARFVSHLSKTQTWELGCVLGNVLAKPARREL